MEKMMKRTLIRYKTKPDMAEKTAELIAGGFADGGGGCATRCDVKGGGVVSIRRPGPQCGRRVVPDRAQHGAGFSAPPQPAGSAEIGRGGGHDCRPCRYRVEPPDRKRKSSH